MHDMVHNHTARHDMVHNHTVWHDMVHNHTAQHGAQLCCSSESCSLRIRVGQNHIYKVYARYLAGNSPNIRCIYTVYIYGSGQPY